MHTNTALAELWETVNECEACALATGRTNVVLGKGNPDADIMIIGEAPGEEEDKAGIPFVGRAGKLVDKALEYAGKSLDDVYICNTVKCRPPNNRNPFTYELYACRGYLNAQIWIVQPKILITLGKIATYEIIPVSPAVQKKSFINFLKQRPYTRHNRVILPEYHPSYIIRSPSKEEDWLNRMKEALNYEVGTSDR